MKTLAELTTLMGQTARTAMHPDSVIADGISLITILFLAFGALIIVRQFIPGVTLFCSMIKGLFSRKLGKNVALPGERNGRF